MTALFPDRLYVEIQRHGLAAEEAVEPHLVDLAYREGLPVVATNEPFFPARADHEAHDALICIAEGAVIADDKRRRLTPEHYFKSRAEMKALFADLPEALANTVEIAMRAAYWPSVRKPILPRFAEASAARPPTPPRRSFCGARRSRDWPGASRPTASRRASPARTTTTGSTTRSGSSSG